MINGLFGRPRSGKSYEAVRYHIIPTALKLRQVVTNIPMNLDKVALVYGQEVADCIIIVDTKFGDYGTQRPFSIPDDFTKYEWRDDKGVGPLFVVDEAHMSVGRDCKVPVREYYSMHGHYGHDIILLSQDPQKIHKDIKNMVEISWRCVKQSAFGKDDKYSKKTYHGVPARNADYIHEEERAYDEGFFPFYKSHTQSKNDVVEATHKDINASVFPHKKKIFTAIALGVIFSVYTGVGMFTKNKPKSDKIPPTKNVVLDDATSSSPAAAAPLKRIKKEEKPLSENQKIINEKKRRSEEYHPLHKVRLHVVGNSDSLQGNKYVNEVYFEATKKDRFVFDLKLSDLYKSGYDVDVLSDCVVKLTYYDYQEYIICDAPQRRNDTIEESTADPTGLIAQQGG